VGLNARRPSAQPTGVAAALGSSDWAVRKAAAQVRSALQRMQKWRIVTLGASGGRSLTGPLRDDRRFPSTRWLPIPGATRKTLGSGICTSFKGHFLSRRAKPQLKYEWRTWLLGQRLEALT
jgi:hypothetical protein